MNRMSRSKGESCVEQTVLKGYFEVVLNVTLNAVNN